MGKTKNILFISQSILLNNTGGGVISTRNLKLLTDAHKDAVIDAVILGPQENTITFSYPNVNVYDFRTKYSRLHTFLNILIGLTTGINIHVYLKICEVIIMKDYDYIFVDGSFFGKVVRFVKKYSKAKVLVFFHNIEIDFWRDSIKKDGLQYLPVYLNASYNENICAKNADFISLISVDDTLRVKQLYQRDVDFILPVSIEKVIVDKSSPILSSELRLLFVGSAFYANVESISWFIKNVMPHVNATLTIVGKDMDKAFAKNLSPNVKVIGYVESLSDVYAEHHVVVAPIFYGAGMKVKIAEALMYGKYIIGSELAFSGYKINSEIAQVCKDGDSFIHTIENYKIHNNFNTKCYELFNTEYSYDSVLSKYLVFSEIHLNK